MISSSNAEPLVRDCLTRAAALALDRALLDANPADAARPAGLRHGISALTASVASDPHTAMVADLTALAAALAPVSGNTPITVIADAPRAMRIKLQAAHELPFTVLTSAAAGNDVIALAPPALVSATGGIDIDASRESATLHMEGATPQPIGNGGIFATLVRSLWQTDSTGLKLRMIANWALRDMRALAWLTPTNW